MAAARINQSTWAATFLATIAKGLVCALPLVPAIRVNLDGAAGQGVAWTTFAIASVVAGAVFIDTAIEGKSALGSILFGVLATFFVSLNVLNAIGNAASHSDVSRDVASSQAAKKQRLEDRRTVLSQGRKEQAATAGAATPDAIEADIRAAKARESKLWSASFQCDPAWITKDATKAFCAEVATLEAKRAAAVRRDKIDADLAALDEKDAEAPPSTVESYVNNMAGFLGALGYEVDDKDRGLIAASRDWLKGVGVELLAAFGPAALLGLLGRFTLHCGATPESEPQPQRKPVGPETAKGLSSAAATAAAAHEATAPQPSADPAIDGFFARRLEVVQGEFIAASALFKAWAADCAEHGIEPGTQKAFSKRIQRRVGYDRNNGRPRYCHVRLKARELAALRLVVGG